MLGSKKRDYKTSDRLTEAVLNVFSKVGDYEGITAGKYDKEIQAEVKRLKEKRK